MKSNRFTAIAAGSLVAMLVAGVAQHMSGIETANAQIQIPGQNQPSPAFAKAYEVSDAFRQVSRQTLPAVVSIKTTGKVVKRTSGSTGRSPFDSDPFFRQFFNDPRMRGFLDEEGEREFRSPSGQGSGFIIGSEGVVLTNAHVVDDAEEVIVRLADGREFKANDVKADARADVAVLRINVAEKLPALPLGNDEQMEIGDWVLAFGSPFGMHRSVTQGIISAKGRGLDGDGKEFIQTDAAINPGNSGGPLVNLRGEVIGINTAISTRSGGYDGVSFAIPVGMVRWVADQLQKSGEVKRAYLGIQMQEIDAQLAQELDLPVPQGVAVTEVVKGSPADVAGFKTGDVILEVNGRRISNPLNMMGVVERLTVGHAYDLKVQRAGRQQDLRITVAERPRLAELQRQRSNSSDAGSQFLDELGIAVQDLTVEIAEQLGMESAEGVVITEVAPTGRAAKFGIEPGMVIARIANKQVRSVSDVISAMDLSRKNGRILLLVKKKSGNSNISRFISVPIDDGR